MFTPFQTNGQFKVIGYVPVSKFFKPDIGKIEFKKITHLNLAFINPDSSGSFSKPPGIDSLIQTAHHFNVKVLASIGGGNSPFYLQKLLTDPFRSKLIDSIVSFIKDNYLDGEDVDLEGDAVDKNYASFINELGIRLKKNKKLLTSAVATYFVSKISTVVLNKFDLINVMSYDYTGPWTPKEPGQHSSYEKAIEDLNYFIKKRGIKKNKIVLGVPFYGYLFSTDSITGVSFRNIIETYPGTEQADTFRINDQSVVYYNGRRTIDKKISLALKMAGGIMIWQLYQDTQGENSLLEIIDQKVKSKKETQINIRF